MKSWNAKPKLSEDSILTLGWKKRWLTLTYLSRPQGLVLWYNQTTIGQHDAITLPSFVLIFWMIVRLSYYYKINTALHSYLNQEWSPCQYKWIGHHILQVWLKYPYLRLNDWQHYTIHNPRSSILDPLWSSTCLWNGKCLQSKTVHWGRIIKNTSIQDL